MNTILILAVVVVAIFGAAILVVQLLSKKIAQSAEQQKNDAALQLIQSQLNETHSQINARLDAAARQYQEAVGRVAEGLGAVLKVGDQMNSQIQNLQGFFRSSKQRGGIGEVSLQQLLSDALSPNLYQMQYSFRKEGVTVDAVVKVGEKLIPVDSKFPLENFERLAKEPENDAYAKAFQADVKTHLDSIGKKYILPQEGTIDQAIMYIPSEAVFYEIATNFGLMEYARRKGVVPASPSLLYIYLRQVMSVYQIGRLAEEGKKILKGMRAIQEEAVKMGKDIDLLDRHMKDAKNSAEAVSGRYIKLTGKIETMLQLEREEAEVVAALEEAALEEPSEYASAVEKESE